MSDPHYLGLLAAYAAAMIGWCAICSVTNARERRLWDRRDESLDRPWLDVVLALIAACCVIAVGQAWQRGWLIPEAGPFSLWAQAVNQALIFSPMVGLLVVRRQSLRTAWVRTDRVAVRVACGIALAGLAMLAYSLVRGDPALWPVLAEEAIDLPQHLDELVQVFFEDLTIAILVVRLAAATRRRWIPPVLVGILFAAGHIPAMLTEGQPLQELLHLVLDAGLAISVIAVAQRSADIWWLWIVHYTMDMSQFVEFA